jgi:hypothetical protein
MQSKLVNNPKAPGLFMGQIDNLLAGKAFIN